MSVYNLEITTAYHDTIFDKNFALFGANTFLSKIIEGLIMLPRKLGDQ